MPDIFHKNDSSSASSAWMIFLLCKLEYTEVHNLGKRYNRKIAFVMKLYTWNIPQADIWNPDIYLILVYLELYCVKLSVTVVIPCYGITQDNYGQKVYTELYRV